MVSKTFAVYNLKDQFNHIDVQYCVLIIAHTMLGNHAPVQYLFTWSCILETKG